jgi:hypothetical protein
MGDIMNKLTSYVSVVAVAVGVLSVAAVSLAGSPTFSDQQICKAAIGAIMGRDPKMIEVVKNEAGIVHLHYVRPNDGSKWANRCKLEGNKIIWASDTGRWRDHPMDETITYNINGQNLEIVQTFTDGSTSQESYQVFQLGK